MRRLLWCALVLVAAEGVVRLGTWIQFRRRFGDFPELLERRDAEAASRLPLTIGVLIDRSAIYPAVLESESSTRVVTFGEIEPDEIGVTLPEVPEPGVIRVVVLGESHGGWTERMQALFDERWGAGRIEVFDLGVPGNHGGTALLLGERFLSRIRPHLVVTYLGFHDLVFYRARAIAIARAARRTALFGSPGVPVAPTSRGLVDLAWDSLAPSTPLAWLEGTWITEPVASYWALERMARGLGAELVVSTFAAPDVPALPEAERRYFEAELEMFWPVLGGAETYRSDLDGYRAALVEFAHRSGAGLADVAGAVHGGRDVFVDVAHLTPAGVDLHARAVADALAPRVDALFERGVPSPVERTLPSIVPLAPAPAPALEPGRCVRGPCPEGTCYVAGGSVRYGNDFDDLGSILARQRAGIGVAEDFWFEDETPEVEVVVSPFCVDRTEASAAAHARCASEGVCPTIRSHDASPPETEAAVFPTLDDARVFCRWRGGRLPTDVEFDAAARGNDSRPVPWDGDWTGTEANYCGSECRFGDPTDASDGFDGPAPIGTFTATSPSGAIDMAGNLWEWIDECFEASSHRYFPPGARDPIVSPLDDCRHFLRGGSYRSYAGVLERRTASGMADTDVPTRGARCVFDFGTVHHVVERRPVGR